MVLKCEIIQKNWRIPNNKMSMKYLSIRLHGNVVRINFKIRNKPAKSAKNVHLHGILFE